jgi:hypothetical protein
VLNQNPISGNKEGNAIAAGPKLHLAKRHFGTKAKNEEIEDGLPLLGFDVDKAGTRALQWGLDHFDHEYGLGEAAHTDQAPQAGQSEGIAQPAVLRLHGGFADYGVFFFA